MLPIMLLAHEHDPDPAMRPPPVANAKREELIQMMIASMTVIYRFFEPHRRSLAQTYGICGMGVRTAHCND